MGSICNKSRIGSVGVGASISSIGAAENWASSCRDFTAFSDILASAAAPAANARKGNIGNPGINANDDSTAATIHMARGCAPSCLLSTVPMRSLPAALVTMRPAAVLMISAGTCDTRPSPTVRSV